MQLRSTVYISHRAPSAGLWAICWTFLLDVAAAADCVRGTCRSSARNLLGYSQASPEHSMKLILMICGFSTLSAVYRPSMTSEGTRILSELP